MEQDEDPSSVVCKVAAMAFHHLSEAAESLHVMLGTIERLNYGVDTRARAKRAWELTYQAMNELGPVVDEEELWAIHLLKEQQAE